MTNKQRISLDDSVDLLRLLQRNHACTHRDISKELRISESTVKRMFTKLRSLGVVIENTGSRRKPNYSITDWGVISQQSLATTAEDQEVHEETRAEV